MRYSRNRRRLRALLDSAPTNLVGREGGPEAPYLHLRERHLIPAALDVDLRPGAGGDRSDPLWHALRAAQAEQQASTMAS